MTIKSNLSFSNKTVHNILIKVRDVESIKGLLLPNNGLLEKNTANALKIDAVEPTDALLGNSFFTFDFFIKDENNKIASLKFWAKASANFRLYEQVSNNTNFMVDTIVGQGHIDITVLDVSPDNATQKPNYLVVGDTTNSFPYYEIQFNKDNTIIDKGAMDGLQQFAEYEGLTDIIFFSHGFNNTPAAARRIYNDYFRNFKKEKSGKKLGVCGVVWYSQINDMENSGQTFYDIARAASFMGIERNALDSGKKLAEHINTKLNASGQLFNKVNIHLAGHSLGTVLMLSALQGVKKLSAKSVFLIQAAMGRDVANPHEAKVQGPMVATFSDKDSVLRWQWTAANTAKAAIPTIAPKKGLWANFKSVIAMAYNASSELLVAPIKYTTENALGFVGPKGRTHRDILKENDNIKYNFPKGKIEGLNASSEINNHDDYKKPSVAKAHQEAADLL